VVEPIYDGLAKTFAPLSLKLDYEHIEETRPKLAELLRRS